MTDIFRPSTSRINEILTGVDVLKCATAGHKVTYIAVPITSGERFIGWHSAQGKFLAVGSEEYRNALHRHVIEPNCAVAASTIGELRSRLGTYVIDPIALERPGWSQDDYRHFWGRVIEVHAERAVFLDGWYYSSGCSYEFFVASWFGIPTISQNMAAIQLADGIAAIERAIRELSRAGITADFQRMVLGELRELQLQLTAV